jgi:diguanylate cyclase (GGDEF)-like protein/PAS domain S-box-containing protein
MMIAPLPGNEAARLAALHDLNVLDTLPEAAYDDITRLASWICGTPIAVVSLVDRDRQWFKSSVGLDAAETPRDVAFCAHAILGGDVLHVPNAAEDARFAANPLVTGGPKIRFYAGAPLTDSRGLNLGTLCVIDRTPRQLSPEQREALAALSRQVVRLLETRRQFDELTRTQETFRVLFEQSSDAHLIFHEADGIIDCNHAAVKMLRCKDKAEVLALHPAVLSPEVQPDGRRSLEKCVEMDATARHLGSHRFDWLHRRMDGEEFPCEVTLTPVELHGRSVLLVVWHDLTERQRAEQALRDSETRFRAFMDNSPAMAFMKDEAGRFVYVNDPVCKKFGIPEAGWLGKTDADLWAPEIAGPLRAIDVEVLTTGRTVKLVETVPTPDGASSRWDSYKFPFTDAHGNRVLAGMAVDVTAAELAAQALRESEQRFRGVVDGLAEGVVLLDRDTRRVLRTNQAFRDLIGYAEAEVAALTQYDFVAHDRADIDEKMAVIAGRGQAALGFRKYRHRSGLTLDVSVSGSLLALEGRAVLCLVVRDMTDLKHAEDVIRASEEKFRGVIERLAEGVFLLDLATKHVVQANSTFLAMLGFTFAELAEKQLYDFVLLDRRSLDAEIELVLKHGQYKLGRRQCRRKDGSVADVDVSVSHVPSRGQNLLAVVLRDMTEQRRYEDQLFDYQVELERTNAKLRELAVTDGLTRVKNRAAFNERLTEAFDRSVRYGHPLSVVLMDVDHFKAFNDTFGHPAGDAVLRQVARCLEETARTTDVVARYGGEEFAIILPDTDFAGAMVLAERCRRAVAAVAWDQRLVTVSVGVSTLAPTTADPAALVREADEALYRSKQAGRNRVNHGSNTIPAAATTRTPVRV